MEKRLLQELFNEAKNYKRAVAVSFNTINGVETAYFSDMDDEFVKLQLNPDRTYNSNTILIARSAIVKVQVCDEGTMFY